MSIKIDNLTYIYSANTPFEKKALDDVTLEINDGEFVGLIGHTGSGKSTLIQQFNGLLKPTSGDVYVNDINIHNKQKPLKEIRQKVGLVFQYPEHQLFEMTVYKDVAYGPTNMGLDAKEIDKRVKDAISTVGLNEEIYEKSPFELSGGQKRRVAIAGVLAMEPDVLILDEPTAGLDPRGRDEILDELVKLHQELGITVILVSHSMEDVGKYVERIIVMDKGKVKYDDTPKKVFNHIKELESMGLGVPQVTYLMHELKDKGFMVSNEVTTIQEAYDEILNIVSKDVRL
ncbi:energy-coupling factor transporter ATP-binding protein EcfA2 [Vallitalea longa]|uniref:Energy-coupling factor transporter ATP-binding protein EcfA2 n=1 Tax=Vallitalea longa TaxID=2936439 RepID=A0A9W5Y8G5_9FIRM|nr:energy-coupling factor transporter ATPase [Vallitalea longa]GKX28424.1 energy-coupling factor transporter ATP-binding protein EcfA2 [Vallitalea longa]